MGDSASKKWSGELPSTQEVLSRKEEGTRLARVVNRKSGAHPQCVDNIPKNDEHPIVSGEHLLVGFALALDKA